MANITLTDAAQKVLRNNKKPMSLLDLFKEARKIAGLADDFNIDEQVSFFTSLSSDGRFTCVEKNMWTLKELLNVSALMVEEDEDEDVAYDEDGEEVKTKSEDNDNDNDSEEEIKEESESDEEDEEEEF